MDLGFSRLRAFVTTARAGSMTAAADALGYTTGAISQQVAALESELGRPLFDRVGRGLRLTEQGTAFLHFAETILRTQSEAIEAVATTRWQPGQPRVKVRLGVFGSLAALAIGAAVADLRQRDPSIRLVSVEFDVDDVADAVRRGEADLAFGIDYPNSPARRAHDVDVTVLATEPLAVAVRTEEAWPEQASITAFSDAQWVMASPTSHFGTAVRHMCRRGGFEPDVVHEVTDTAACLAMVASGLGVTPATPLMHLVRPAGLRLVGLTDGDDRQVVVFSRSSSVDRPSRRSVIEALRRSVQDFDVRPAEDGP